MYLSTYLVILDYNYVFKTLGFIQEETIIQYIGKYVGIILNLTPRFHP